MGEISRRGVLVGGGGIAVLAITSVTTVASPAFAAPGRPSLQPVSSALTVRSAVPVAVPTRGFGSLQTTEVPAVLEFDWPAGWSRNAVVDVSYDPRQFQLVDHFKASAGSKGIPAKLAGSRFSFSVPSSSNSVALEFAVPLRALNNFPVEDVAPLQPVVITLSDAADPGNSVTVESTTASSALERAWGIELYGIWASAETAAAGRLYRRPAGVRVLSVGPSPSPASAVIQVVADARIIERMSVSSAARNNRAVSTPTAAAASDGAATLRIPIGVELQSGETLDLAFSSVDHTGALDGVRIGAISLVAANEATWLQRVTGRETSVSTTRSGAPATAHQYLGRI